MFVIFLPAVDESIMESLHQLNIDFPNVDSPANPRVEMHEDSCKSMEADIASDMPKFDDTPLPTRGNACVSSLVPGDGSSKSIDADVSPGLPLFDGTPISIRAEVGGSSVVPGVGSPKEPVADVHTEQTVFDKTPLPSRDDVGDSGGAPGERTVGPIFDPTPMHGVHRDQLDATNPPAIECTPVWQDTPSQSVDGTEEVTQEHNVQDQLDKYAEHQAVKKADYEKRLKAYHKKYPKKVGQGSDAACPNVPSEDLHPAASPISKKTRMAVAKKKSDYVGTPRRSTRLACSVPVMSSSHSSPPPAKSSSAKRKRVADDTYILDAASGDADSDFEADFVEVVFFFVFTVVFSFLFVLFF